MMTTEASAGPAPVLQDDDEISLVALANVLLRWRRTIIGLGLVGAAAGLAMGLTSTRVYVSSATFIPQGPDQGGASGLSIAASQLGIRVPANSGAWGPPVYVELLGTQALLELIAVDSVAVAEEGGRRVALADLLKIPALTPVRRIDGTVRALRKIVVASEEKRLGAVKLSVTTRWPSVSLSLVERLLRGVNQFNLKMRKSQAAAERQFVEVQAGEAERALREAEDRLQVFLQRNRAIADSPELEFQRDRLQRDVALRQQVYASLAQNREEARIREVRDTPVISVLEEPRLSVVSESRRSILKGVLGGIGGGGLGALIAILAQWVTWVRKAPSAEAREFFRLIEEATPRLLRRGGQ